jgi:hypothetical protein
VKQDAAIELMDSFAERTGLVSDTKPRRYLWTDAFAVVNWLALHRRTQDPRYRTLAIDLIGQVHAVLGRHRADDPRTGWLSGLAEDAGAAHPTAGGLRIGKPLPERRPEEPADERLEWDRDGQYFHYLTKWMDALVRAGSLLGEPRYRTWAAELAQAVFPRFLQRAASGEPLGLAWKMSIDLSRPQVAGLSPHDALDGYVTFRWLDAGGSAPSLGEETELLRGLVLGRRWGTADPLGLGGLLLDAMRLALLAKPGDARLTSDILAGVAGGLAAFARSRALEAPPSRRLGFRELGLAIGLQGLEPLRDGAAALQPARGIGPTIVDFWLDEGHRQSPTWQDHRDINDVMLATALLDAQADTAVLGRRLGNIDLQPSPLLKGSLERGRAEPQRSLRERPPLSNFG